MSTQVNEQAAIASLESPRDLRAWCSRTAYGLALALLAATFFLISPVSGQAYPGQIPWSEMSMLRPITDLMSLYGLFETARGVEIKDFALHAATVLGLLLLAVAQFASAPSGPRPRAARTAGYAQLLLAGWVTLSVVSGWWSGDASLSVGQATLYALHLGWAVALAHTFDRRDLPRLAYGVMTITSLGAGLCVWYYFERNPAHRPGFPLGNPTVLAPAIVPGVLIAGVIIAGTILRRMRDGVPAIGWPLIGSVAALIPLMWCLWLTWSRGALLALVAGAALMVVLSVGRRARWLMAGGLAAMVVAAGLWWAYASRLDVTMARGATVRFRVYAWGYAARLWQASPMAGNGAGSYPRTAEYLAVQDRALDPAAFMGRLVEHTHNELFEVLSEIGLVGGVTFVGGLLATLLAGVLAVARARPGPERWLTLAIVGAVGALIADSMIGVALRLPGGAAVFFTLVGVLWGVCRTAVDAEFERGREAKPRGAASVLRTAPAALACVLAACGAGWFCAQNVRGVLNEQAGRSLLQAAQAGEATEPDAFATARDHLKVAEERMLDPVRRILARESMLRCRKNMAGQAFVAARPAPNRPPNEEHLPVALSAVRETYEAAVRLRLDVPALVHLHGEEARTAEWMYQLLRERDPESAADWIRRAEAGHRQQRMLTPFDVGTLLALQQYPGSMSDYLGQLRDALREGEPRGQWLAMLGRLQQHPQFAPTLNSFLAGAGPITPNTDIDTLIASRAPEVHRLVAAFHAQCGQWDLAVRHAGQAAQLYDPMRVRFPTLHSIALGEQAEYLFRGDPTRASEATVLLDEALKALPRIQDQKMAAMAAPYRMRLVQTLLAEGDEMQTRRVLGELGVPEDEMPARLAMVYTDMVAAFIRHPVEKRPAVERWLAAALVHEPANVFAWSWRTWLAAETGDAVAVRAVLADAAAAGVDDEGVRVIERGLRQEFPELWGSE